MKLYLWRAVLTDYTDGCAFAIAETIEDAMAQLRVTFDSSPGWSPFADPNFEWTVPEIHDLTEPFGFWRYGGG